MLSIQIIPYEEFQRVLNASMDKYKKLTLISDMNRANTLAEVKRAGSGHLGSSFSAMDIVTWLYYEEMNVLKVGFDSPERDIYFSSKGHDVPGLYATMYSLARCRKKNCSSCVATADSTVIQTSTSPASKPTPARLAWASRKDAAWHGRRNISGMAGRSTS